TFIGTKSRFNSAARSSFSNDSRSMTWHQWHVEYPIERKMGLFSRRAFSNASWPQGYQSTGLCACCRRYGLFSSSSRFTFQWYRTPAVRTLRLSGEHVVRHRNREYRGAVMRLAPLILLPAIWLAATPGKPQITTLIYLVNRPDCIASFQAHADKISIIAPQTFY